MKTVLLTAATMHPTELQALTEYAAEKGRTWKAALREDWYHARRPGALQALRNTPAFGPKGLDAFYFPPSMPKAQADLTQLPPVVAPVYEGGNGAGKLLNAKGDAFLWSGTFPVPAIGDTVTVTMNALGGGTVVGYFTEGGYLGLMVTLTAPPKWMRKQNPKGDPAMVFGIEVRAAVTA